MLPAPPAVPVAVNVTGLPVRPVAVAVSVLVPAVVPSVQLPTVAKPLALVDRKSTRLNSSHGYISYAVFCLKKKKHRTTRAGPLPRLGDRGDADPAAPALP